MPAKANCLGRRGRLQNPSGWHCVPPDWYHQPSSSGQCYRLPEERVNGCVCSVGVVSSRARLTDGAWGGWGDGRKGEGCQVRNEELVVLSGKATAGDASGAGKKHVAPALPLGPFWHQVLPTPKPLENRCLAAYSQRVWAGVRWWTVC